MKSKEELIWDVLIKLLEKDSVFDSFRLSENPTEVTKQALKFSNSIAYDYLRYINGELK